MFLMSAFWVLQMMGQWEGGFGKLSPAAADRNAFQQQEQEELIREYAEYNASAISGAGPRQDYRRSRDNHQMPAPESGRQPLSRSPVA